MAAPILAIMAAEPSGDVQGGALARALKAAAPGIRLIGVGGVAMAEAGVELWRESHLWSSIGPGDALLRVPGMLLAYREMRRRLSGERPALTVLIDAPAIHMRLAGFLRRQGLRSAYYFPPSAWTRSPGRLRQIHARTDAVIAAFRGNARLYEELGLPVAWFGHPLRDLVTRVPGPDEARRRLGLRAEEVLTVMPGSRSQEVRLLLPDFLEAAHRLRDRRPGLEVLIPCASPPLEARIRARLGRCPPWLRVLRGQGQLALAASRAALMASGSASLEAALLGIPMVLAYRLGPLDAALGRSLVALRLLRVDRFGLPNLVLGRDVVPELLQERVTPARLVEELEPLLAGGAAREAMVAALAQVGEALGGEGVVEKVAGLALGLASGRALGELLAEAGGRAG